MMDGFSADALLDAIQGLDSVWIYLIIFLAGYLENCIPPVPGDTVTVFAAYLVGTGRLNYFAVFITATLGNLSGFMTMYHLGRHFGKEYFLRKNWKWFPKTQFEKAELWFQKYGYKIILFNRFLSGFRSVISIFSGMAQLQRRKIIPLALVSACMWDGVLIYGGYLVGNNWNAFIRILDQYNIAAVAMLTGLFVLYGVYKLIKSRFQQTNSNR